MFLTIKRDLRLTEKKSDQQIYLVNLKKDNFVQLNAEEGITANLLMHCTSAGRNKQNVILANLEFTRKTRNWSRRLDLLRQFIRKQQTINKLFTVSLVDL